MRKSEKEALQAMLDDEQETIKALEKAYQRAIRRIDNHIRILESDEMTQSKIYQKRYQEAMKAQISAALDELHKKSNQTIEEYLTRSYQHGYVGTMYSLHKQGMPILAPIDQRAVTRAVRTDSKLSGRLYGELGVDMRKLKKTIRREISIGISIGSDYSFIARQVQISSGIPLKRAKTIVRTEGHRIQQQSADDARNAAKGQGCQVVKQWDAVLDGNTRTDHRVLDGQIRASRRAVRDRRQESAVPRRIRATGRGLQLPVRGADKGEVGAECGRVADHEGQGAVLRAGQGGGVQGV